MKPMPNLKIMRMLLVAAFISLLPLLIYATGCGGSSPTPTPISIPAPTGGYINSTAPSEGKIFVYGYIYVEDEPLPNIDVLVTNTSTSGTASTTADENAYFSTEIEASVGDSINVQYQDPATGNMSDPSSFTTADKAQPMPTSGMIQQDVDVDTNEGYAYIVANDGTDSQIIQIDLATGSLAGQSPIYTDATFDKIAVHSGINYAAILDTGAASNQLYWCDLTDVTGTCSRYDISNTPYDVAVSNLNDTPAPPTDDMVVVSREYSNWGLLDIFSIPDSAPATLNSSTTQNCISHPDDTPYPWCSAAMTVTPLRATLLSITKDSSNRARLALAAEYNEAGTTDVVVHYIYFSQLGNNISIAVPSPGTATYPASLELAAGINPYAIAWYAEGTALATDSVGGNLIMLEESGGTISSQSLAVGTGPKGVAGDSDNNRAFVADEGQDSVLTIDMTNFELSGTEYDAHYQPTELTYYGGASTGKIGVILTSPEQLFLIIDVSQ